MSYRSLCWEEIEPGAELPPVVYELSLLRLIAFVRATGLYDYVHFDRDYAQSVGARDVFISTPHVAGLFGRLLTDWSGPEGTLRSLSFSMNGQSCSNDILTVTGRVGKKYQNEQGEFLVDIVDMNIAHKLTPKAATAFATMTIPSRSRPRANTVATDLAKPAISPNAQMPDFIKPLIGKPKALDRPIRPVTADAIHLWCECLEDWNPLYWDKEHAENSASGGLIAPAVGNFFGTGSSASVGIGYMKPGERVPDPVQRGLTGPSLLQNLRENFLTSNSAITFSDYPEVVVAELRADYKLSVRPGDLLRLTQELSDCTSIKKTRLGEGYFVTSLECTYNQRDELVKTLTKKTFYYRP